MPMTDLKTLKQLVKLMVDNDLTEIDLEGEGEKVTLRRAQGGPEVQYVQPPPAAAPASPPAGTAPAAAGEAAPASTEQSGQSGEADTGATIDSPMVGTFYASPSPDADLFVNVGDRVEPETVVCLVEAMKVFNEIKAETSGTIEKAYVENGQAVEYGQPLFQVRPD